MSAQRPIASLAACASAVLAECDRSDRSCHCSNTRDFSWITVNCLNETGNPEHRALIPEYRKPVFGKPLFRKSPSRLSASTAVLVVAALLLSMVSTISRVQEFTVTNREAIAAEGKVLDEQILVDEVARA
jgi:hypothetical protein